jgi:hypothetical protein
VRREPFHSSPTPRSFILGTEHLAFHHKFQIVVLHQCSEVTGISFPAASRSNQRWHRIVCQMVEKLNRGINSLSTGWAPRNDYAFSALRDRWRLINEIRKIVPVNFFLDFSKQEGFLHNKLLTLDVQRKESGD